MAKFKVLAGLASSQVFLTCLWPPSYCSQMGEGDRIQFVTYRIFEDVKTNHRILY